MLKNKKVFAIGLLSIFTVTAHASTPHIVVAPQCLIKDLHATYQTLAIKNKLALIQIEKAGIQQLVAAKEHRVKPCDGFVDVTSTWQNFNATGDKAYRFLTQYTTPAPVTLKKIAYRIQYPTETNRLIAQLNPQSLWADLTTLTNFHDRYADSDNGIKAAEWFKEQIETMAAGRDDVTVYFIQTPDYKQPSVVAKLGNSNEPGIVIGGHMDTTAGKKPGADDDGTGSVTVLQVARAIFASGMHFKKPIYFMWYAAEEEGLLGSQQIVSEFEEKNIPISAVIHFDMTGYRYKDEPTMWLIDDNVNQDLTAFLETLINTYVKQPVQHTACGYDCSDHASWTRGGVPAAISFESEMNKYNPYIHSSQDTMEKLSLDHMTNYAKLAAAFAVELAEPVA